MNPTAARLTVPPLAAHPPIHPQATLVFDYPSTASMSEFIAAQLHVGQELRAPAAGAEHNAMAAEARVHAPMPMALVPTPGARGVAVTGGAHRSPGGSIGRLMPRDAVRAVPFDRCGAQAGPAVWFPSTARPHTHTPPQGSSFGCSALLHTHPTRCDLFRTGGIGTGCAPPLPRALATRSARRASAAGWVAWSCLTPRCLA